MSLLPYARLLRLPNVFTALADIAMAGFAVFALAPPPGDAAVVGFRFAALLLASACFYCSGMVWNDYFDVEQDRRERGFRPLPSGQISMTAAWRLGNGLMAAGVAFCVIADWGSSLATAASFRFHSTLIGFLLVVAIFLYDRALKATAIAPVFMGLCRFLNVLLGLSLSGQAPFFWGWGLALVVGLYITGVTWFARREATVSNPGNLALGSSLMLTGLTLALIIPILVQESRPAHEPPLVFPYLLFCLGLYLGLAVIPALKRPLPQRVQPAVKRSILGLIFLDATLAGAIIGYLGFALVLLYLPAVFLGRWLYST